jgi:leucyl aminopeptidase
MHLSNYEWTLKSDIKDEETKTEEDLDERTKRTKKPIDSIELSHEKDLRALESFNKQVIAAEATIFARNLANVRGNPANP